jgi:hypothetical protein
LLAPAGKAVMLTRAGVHSSGVNVEPKFRYVSKADMAVKAVSYRQPYLAARLSGCLMDSPYMPVAIIKRRQLFENLGPGTYVHRKRLYGDLFVDLSHHITGLGSDLVRHGLALCPKITTDVNEQNTQAIGFDGLNKK